MKKKISAGILSLGILSGALLTTNVVTYTHQTKIVNEEKANRIEVEKKAEELDKRLKETSNHLNQTEKSLIQMKNEDVKQKQTELRLRNYNQQKDVKIEDLQDAINRKDTKINDLKVELHSKKEREEKERQQQLAETKQKKQATALKSDKQKGVDVQSDESSKKTVTASEDKNTSSGRTLKMTATAYTAECYGCSGVTATGINLNNNRNAKVIAVDPSVIPLGSTVHVEGYGRAIAGDTGGAIKGNKIDLHMATESQANAWGVRTVIVTIVN